LVQFDPFRNTPDFPTLRFFDDAVSRLLEPSAQRPWAPSVDVLETQDALMLKADLPGVDMKNIDVQLENGTLTLKGERRFEEVENGKAYHRIERGYGSFTRAFSLPETVDGEHVKADYKNGVLTVTLPKKELAKPRQIKVSVENN
jgi:HSP20 family protein